MKTLTTNLQKDSRVSWCGTEHHGTVKEINSKEIHVFWDTPRDSPFRYWVYAPTDATVQPIQ